ncbi:MAG: PadR family transcriptional regulator [Candidatus Hodarchaeota archaeon]
MPDEKPDPDGPFEEISPEEARETKAFRRLEANLTTKALWLYVLRLLTARDMYGYEVRKAIRDEFKIRMATVTAYVVLYKLAQEKLVTTEKTASTFRGRPDRKYYSITPKGQTVLSEAKNFVSGVYERLFETPNSEEQQKSLESDEKTKKKSS